MPLFQKSVLNKYISDIDKEVIKSAWVSYQAHFLNPTIQANIRDAKEEEYQEGFVRDLFVNILGYTLKPQPNYNFVLEKKTETDATKSDGALLRGDSIIGVVELKDTGTTELDKIEKQVFGYKHKHKHCVYVITSNFEKLRFYINDATEYEEFDLFNLTVHRFTVLYICLQQQHIQKDIPLAIKNASVAEEESVTKKLYADYSGFKRALFSNIVTLNPQYNKLELYKKTQKLLDRLLFIFFAEDRLLLPPNSIRQILRQWEQLKELDSYVPLYSRFIKYFGYLNTGHVGKQEEIFAYNGGLFEPDDILDNLKIDDAVLFEGSFKISHYDFDSEVDVNILGHIFEHSLSEIEEVQAELEGQAIDKTKTKRKKDGVFYTPRYITKYIVDNTVGELCRQQKDKLGIADDAFTPQKRKANTKQLQQKLEDYRNWLLQLTICDPACGSGAFLNQALDFLIEEHKMIDELTARLFGSPMVLSDVETAILENNIFGVDINEEAVEIARLSLWLRTARKGRKLNNLSQKIKCGNSLIDDPAIAGSKAFNWQQEFAQVFDKGGFDVVIGNPPYGATISKDEKQYFLTSYETTLVNFDTYGLFFEKSFTLLKHKGYLGFITPNTYLVLENGEKLRSFLFKKNSIVNFLETFNVFEDAVVEPITVIIRKEIPSNENTLTCILFPRHGKYFKEDILNYETLIFKQNDLLERDDLIFNYRATVENRELSKKIESNSQYLSSFAKITAGVKPYEKGKGNPAQTREVVNSKPYTGYNKTGEEWKKLIRGTQVRRYLLEWDNEYIIYGDNLAAPRNSKSFYEPKIFIRRTDDKILAVYDEDNLIGLNSIHCLQLSVEKISLKYILSLLNSRLINWFFRFQNFHMVGKPLAEVKVVFIERLPIILPIQQLPFIAKADIMLSKNKELQQVRQQLLQLLQGKYSSLTLSKKLQDWPALSFAAFLKELQKQKIKLTLPEEAEWLKYFDEQKATANSIQQVIDTTDKEIDKMVYELYGLTEEEIKIVEES